MAEPDYVLYSLPNGLRLAHKKVSGTRLVHCGYIIKAGSRNDGDLPGIAHCLEHMVFKGTAKRRTIHVLNHLEVVGGEMNAFTTKEITAIYATVQATHYSRAADILSDVVFRSTIPDQELVKEKKVISEEIKMYKDTPEENIYDEFHEIVFNDHPLAHNILGTEDSLTKTKRKDILEFINKWYLPENMVFVVVGNISAARAIAGLEKFTADLEFKKKAITKDNSHKVKYSPKLVHKDTDFMQAYCILGAPAYAETNAKRWKLMLLNNLLGGPGLNSRLNLAIREKYGLAYQVESGYQAYRDSGMFHCYLGAEKKQIERSVDLVVRELKKLKKEKLGTLQLSRFKNQFCGQLIMADENRSGLMVHIGKSILTEGKVRPLKEILAEIQLIGASDIMDTANEIFDSDKFSRLTYWPI